jgi:hypothetical protein
MDNVKAMRAQLDDMRERLQYLADCVEACGNLGRMKERAEYLSRYRQMKRTYRELWKRWSAARLAA